jgi:hypothetical protein
MQTAPATSATTLRDPAHWHTPHRMAPRLSSDAGSDPSKRFPARESSLRAEPQQQRSTGGGLLTAAHHSHRSCQSSSMFAGTVPLNRFWPRCSTLAHSVSEDTASRHRHDQQRRQDRRKYRRLTSEGSQPGTVPESEFEPTWRTLHHAHMPRLVRHRDERRETYSTSMTTAGRSTGALRSHRSFFSRLTKSGSVPDSWLP